MNTGISFGRILTLEDRAVGSALDLIQEITKDSKRYTPEGVRAVLQFHISDKHSDILSVLVEDEMYGLCILQKSLDFEFREVAIRKYFCKGGHYEFSISDKFLEYVVDVSKKKFDNRDSGKLIIRHFPRFCWESYTELFVRNHFSIKSFRVNSEGNQGFPNYFQRVVAP